MDYVIFNFVLGLGSVLNVLYVVYSWPLSSTNYQEYCM